MYTKYFTKVSKILLSIKEAFFKNISICKLLMFNITYPEVIFCHSGIYLQNKNTSANFAA